MADFAAKLFIKHWFFSTDPILVKLEALMFHPLAEV